MMAVMEHLIPSSKIALLQIIFARDGAALYNYAFRGETSAAIVDCSFLFNRADLFGGAITNNGNHGICNPIIQDCNFSNNGSFLWCRDCKSRGIWTN